MNLWMGGRQSTFNGDKMRSIMKRGEFYLEELKRFRELEEQISRYHKNYDATMKMKETVDFVRVAEMP